MADFVPYDPKIHGDIPTQTFVPYDPSVHGDLPSDRGVLDKVSDFGRVALDSATFGLADPIKAAIRTGTQGGNYSDNLADSRKSTDDAGNRLGTVGKTAAEITGVLPTMIVPFGGEAALAAKLGTVGGKIGARALEGAAIGAAQQAGHSNSASEILPNAARGAALGGVIGGGIPLGGAIVSGIDRGVGAAASKLSGVSLAEQDAIRAGARNGGIAPPGQMDSTSAYNAVKDLKLTPNKLSEKLMGGAGLDWLLEGALHKSGLGVPIAAFSSPKLVGGVRYAQGLADRVIPTSLFTRAVSGVSNE